MNFPAQKASFPAQPRGNLLSKEFFFFQKFVLGEIFFLFQNNQLKKILKMKVLVFKFEKIFFFINVHVPPCFFPIVQWCL